MLAVQEQPPAKQINYPETDGEPMAETDVHRDLLLETVEMLKMAFPDAYVSGNICLYYEEDNSKKMISPDALVCLAQKPMQKRVYKAWEANAQLDLVMEFSSPATKQVDYRKKKAIYENILRVPYYLIFDPMKRHLDLFELCVTGYCSVPVQMNRRWHLSQMGLQVSVESPHRLRLFDQEGNPIPTPYEKERAAKEIALKREEQERTAKEIALKREEQERTAKETALQREEIALQREEIALQREEQERTAKETALQREEIALQREEQERTAKETALQREEKALQQVEMERQIREELAQQLQAMQAQLKVWQAKSK